jgi:hypothetical protein
VITVQIVICDLRSLIVRCHCYTVAGLLIGLDLKWPEVVRKIGRFLSEIFSFDL